MSENETPLDPQRVEDAGTYRAATGRTYRYQVQAGDWDLDHPEACLFTFLVTGPTRTFEKVIPVEPEEVASASPGDRQEVALRAAEAHLFLKLDDGNEADEPTPLR